MHASTIVKIKTPEYPFQGEQEDQSSPGISIKEEAMGMIRVGSHMPEGQNGEDWLNIPVLETNPEEKKAKKLTKKKRIFSINSETDIQDIQQGLVEDNYERQETFRIHWVIDKELTPEEYQLFQETEDLMIMILDPLLESMDVERLNITILLTNAPGTKHFNLICKKVGDDVGAVDDFMLQSFTYNPKLVTERKNSSFNPALENINSLITHVLKKLGLAQNKGVVRRKVTGDSQEARAYARMKESNSITTQKVEKLRRIIQDVQGDISEKSLKKLAISWAISHEIGNALINSAHVRDVKNIAEQPPIGTYPIPPYLIEGAAELIALTNSINFTFPHFTEAQKIFLANFFLSGNLSPKGEISDEDIWQAFTERRPKSYAHQIWSLKHEENARKVPWTHYGYTKAMSVTIENIVLQMNLTASELRLDNNYLRRTYYQSEEFERKCQDLIKMVFIEPAKFAILVCKLVQDLNNPKEKGSH